MSAAEVESQPSEQGPGCPRGCAGRRRTCDLAAESPGAAPCPYLVEGGRGRGAHHQRDADDGVAVEAVRVGHHHDASDGEDGGHDLGGRKQMLVRAEAGGRTGHLSAPEVELS